MKNAPLVLSGLSLLGVIVLFALHFSGPRVKPVTTIVAKSSPGAAVPGARIAWVDADTFQEKFTYLKTKRAEFEKRQDAIKAELSRGAQQMQADYASVQEKAQKGALTEAEGKAAQQRLGQMDQQLQNKEQALTAELVKAQDAFNAALRKNLQGFLEEYGREKGFDYVLNYSVGSGVMWASAGSDITAEVIAGMNERMKDAGNKVESEK